MLGFLYPAVSESPERGEQIILYSGFSLRPTSDSGSHPPLWQGLEVDSGDRMGLGKEGMFSFLRPFVFLEKQWLFGYFGEPVIKEILQNFSVRGRWQNRKNGEHEAGSPGCHL